ncbi:protein FAM47E-like isoform X2 [Lineus longissimus]|uniref:protein FAM47E-like isoform X2 n=1 Tax=Lineus longissimus TaxID=88925 RepID=UPI002B4E70F8
MAMAEAKYDLALINTVNSKKIQHQPWFKERLKTRHIKSLKKTDTSRMLIGKNWTFIKDGLDDFRDGLPPPMDHGIILAGQKGPSPNITGSNESVSSVKQPVVRDRFNKHEICFSRCTPLQQQRRDHIDEIEYGLTQHPLALYPHLEECMPPEIFEDVVDILDPEMNLADDEDDEDEYSDISDTQQTTPLPHDTTDKSRDDASDTDIGDDPDANQGVRNPYRWLPRKDEKDKKDKKREMLRRSSSPSQDEHIKSVTKDFCDWVASLGGESNNIEESTITSLFASGYETKPALSVPIHVVELTNVPPELRMSATVPQQQTIHKNIPTDDKKKSEWTFSGEYEPSWVKFKYGAWYLPTKMWKKRDNEEPLQDPKELKDQEMSEAKKKSNGLDAELAPMHGAKSFMEFIDKKATRRPEFLDRVAEYQAKAEEEERLRLEAEATKQKKQRLHFPKINTKK